MHCDICISSIDRKRQSARISDHKLSLQCYWNHMLLMVILPAQMCFLWQTVNKKNLLLFLPHIRLCLFLDNHRASTREKKKSDTCTHTLTCHVKTRVLLLNHSLRVDVCEGGPDHFKETCCRFFCSEPKVISSSGKKLFMSSEMFASCFAIMAIWNYSSRRGHVAYCLDLW